MLRHLCPPARMEQLGSHWPDFHEIWYLSIFRKSVEKIKVPLRSDMNNGYFTWRTIYFLITFHSFLLGMRNVSNKSCTVSHNTPFLFNSVFSFENRAVYEIMWKKIWYSWTGHIWQYGACALHAGYLKLETRTQNM